MHGEKRIEQKNVTMIPGKMGGGEECNWANDLI